MKAITLRQTEVFDYIKDFLFEYRYPPTMKEIGDNFSISKKAAYDHVKALEKKGYVRCSGNRSRAIEICSEHQEVETIKIPILGSIAAGLPLFSEENSDGEIYLPASSLKNGRHFALRVHGESMKDAGIIENDLAIFVHQQTAENGQIIAAMTEEGGYTLKRFFKESSRIRLKAENPEYPDIYTSDIRILGRLINIFRHYE